MQAPLTAEERSTEKWGIPEELARGVYRLRMPLPFRLDHINLYVLDDPDGWTIVDCGLNIPEVMELWEHALTTHLGAKPVIRIIVTHLHPDHIGLANWLQQRTGAPIYMTRGEWRMAQDVFNLPLSDAPRVEKHYRSLGLQNDALSATVRQASAYRRLVKILPEHVNHLHEHETLDIGGRRWRILVGHGHSPACACLWDESEQLLIVGDHVLPSITPNINLLTIGPSNPLDDFLTSLGTFRSLPCTFAMPAHGAPIWQFRQRIDELIGHHSARLERLQHACATPLTAAECVPLLFKTDLPNHQYFFAVGESAAHLVYLAERGSLRREGDVTWKFGRM